MSVFRDKLAAVHRRLDEEVRREIGQRSPGNIRVLRLKKLKLQVKDRLHSFQQSFASA